MTTIEVNIFSESSVKKAVKELRKYKKWLDKKTDELRIRIAQELEKLVQEGFNGSKYDDLLDSGASIPNVTVDTTDDGKVSLVIAHGKEAVFVEFGAGVYYNGGNTYPGNKPEGVVEIGTYGYGYGAFETWSFKDENGIVHTTRGTPASMPMYNATLEIARRYVDIAKEVFSSK